MESCRRSVHPLSYFHTVYLRGHTDRFGLICPPQCNTLPEIACMVAMVISKCNGLKLMAHINTLPVLPQL